MPTSDEWLDQGFLLRDHPFEPAREPIHDLDGKIVNVNFSKPLDAFGTKELKDYFQPIGSFNTAVTDISSFLDGFGKGMDQSSPPVVLIEGPAGNGRKTVGNFAAHLMKEHCARPPRLQTIPVTTNHFGRLLFEIKQALELHFTKKNIDTSTVKSRDNSIKAEDPDESNLAGLFSIVAQENLSPPVLILLIGPLRYRNHSDWIGKLHGMLKDLNVALMFTTEDKLITELFKKAIARGDYPGCPVRLAPLTMQDGKSLIINRLLQFRKQPPPAGLAPLTPYEIAGIEWIFKEDLVIRHVLNLCRLTLNRKLSQLVGSKTPVPPLVPGDPGTQINVDDFKVVFGTAMSKGSWGGSG